uniref:Uncharacterized protein n=1 Tax=Rhizophora mucronata TaxID=61149 RepID=A0A2P2N9E7_RHIMU
MKVALMRRFIPNHFYKDLYQRLQGLT